MVDKDVIKSKITHIKSSLDRLAERKKIGLDQLKSNRDLQDIVLYNLQTAIQACIDIASHIISDEGWQVPPTLAGLFDVLLEKNVIDSDLNKKMKSMVGFRNIIVHEYQQIDLDKVHKFLQNNLDDFKSYIKKICEHSNI